MEVLCAAAAEIPAAEAKVRDVARRPGLSPMEHSGGKLARVHPTKSRPRTRSAGRRGLPRALIETTRDYPYIHICGTDEGDEDTEADASRAVVARSERRLRLRMYFPRRLFIFRFENHTSPSRYTPSRYTPPRYIRLATPRRVARLHDVPEGLALDDESERVDIFLEFPLLAESLSSFRHAHRHGNVRPGRAVRVEVHHRYFRRGIPSMVRVRRAALLGSTSSIAVTLARHAGDGARRDARASRPAPHTANRSHSGRESTRRSNAATRISRSRRRLTLEVPESGDQR